MTEDRRERLALWAGVAMAALLVLVLFAWMALKALVEPGSLGAPGRLALKLASLPSRVASAWGEAVDNLTGEEATRYLSVPRPEIDMTGFRPVLTAGGQAFSGLLVRGDAARAERGWRVLGGAMEVDGKVESAVVMLDPGMVVRRVWVLDEDAVEVAGKSLDSRRVLHGLAVVPETGSIVFNLDYGSAVQRRDACNRVEWIAPGKYHHSVMPSEDGRSFWTMRLGGFPSRHAEGDLTTPENTGFVQLDAATGAVLAEFSLEDLMAANPGLGLFELGRVDANEAESNAAHVVGQWLGDPLHFNDVEPLPAAMAGAFPEFAPGDLLVSARNTNSIMVIDPQTHKVKWHQTGGFLRQHDPDWRPDGTISVYDNAMGHGVSRIVSVDVETHRIRMTYDGSENGFYSRVRGKHMRTARGDLAVVSAQQGRAFELDAAGRPVLEFLSLMPGSEAKAFGLNEYLWLPEAAIEPGDPTCDNS